MSDIDDNPRPLKRQRRNSKQGCLFSPTADALTESEALTGLSSRLTVLPPANLLISLPALLVHPPNHRSHVQFLALSLLAIRKCLSYKNLNPDIECRAWTALAEIGMKIIGGGFSQSEEHTWAKHIEIEVEKAASKALLIAQKHPSLRAYTPHLTILSARLSQWQHNSKYARNLLRRLLNSFIPSDPPHIIYTAHLAFISHLITPAPRTPGAIANTISKQDIQTAFAAIQELQNISIKNAHVSVTLLTRVLHLRVLVSSGMWNQVHVALQTVEESLELAYPDPPHQSSLNTPLAKSSPSIAASFKLFNDPFETAMAIHVLIIGVIFYTYAGRAADTAPRLSHLHALLDSGAMSKFKWGIVEIQLPESPPLHIQTTHPQVLYLLAFLVSSTAKRDAVGRKPRRKVFAAEGLVSWEREVNKEISVPPWAGVADLQEVQTTMAKIKGDLLCELIGVSIMRSEFDVAEQNLALLIAHVRTYNLFPAFAPRITLHHAHLAHALGQIDRALQCYIVAANLSEEKHDFVYVAAKAGEVALRLGMCRVDEGEIDRELEKMGRSVIEDCRGMGATLAAVEQVVEACLSTEILKAKQHLKNALGIATKAQDNHMRALILALISSHYFHTAGGHAQQMLATCGQLAAGLGASGSRAEAGDGVGNATLRLWVGERFLELYKRAGNDVLAEKQVVANEQLKKAVEQIAQRSLATPGSSAGP